MKKQLLILVLFFISRYSDAQSQKTIPFALDDSVKAVQFMAEINVQSINTKKEVFAGIKTDAVKLSLESDKKGREIVFEFPESARVMATGLNVDADEKGEIGFAYNWSINECVPGRGLK